jgi:hypothetical protein
MIRHRQYGLCPPGFPARQTQTLEGLRGSHLVYQMAIDVQQGRPVLFLAYKVGFPEFVIEGLAGHINQFHRG